MHYKRLSTVIAILIAMVSCSTQKTGPDAEVPAAEEKGKIKLITLDPGHFHAALVQKPMYENVDSVVHVFAPEGDEVRDYLKRIESYNTRADDPTRWQEEVYTGPDYFEKMLFEKPGNVVVVAGNNKLKTNYIKASIDSGLNVFADKPMAINSESFELLKQAFAAAEKKDLLLYDIMTERFEITTLLQREFSMLPEVFGTLQKGTAQDPAVTKESVHHFSKIVSGSPLIRPAWFFDVEQQGEGIVDVTTHLVDLVQWECFPEQVVDYQSDVNITSARHWKTNLTSAQFEKVTGLKSYPDYLKKDVDPKGTLGVFSNGEINYQIKGINAKVSVIWNFEAPAGAGDTHFSIMKGSKSNLIIRQGKEENYKPVLYIEPLDKDDRNFEGDLKGGLAKVQTKYPGVEIKRVGDLWAVSAPEKYHNGHEAHFGQVTEKYLEYLQNHNMPAWEVPNMIAKYFITTRALEIAKGAK
ncbi:MAG TPA: putative oxidoreductase C-terminal domain-containing protein [Chryseosolibacter sp.]|nr:putative oxidoreductase C-terminal domain-containing protein [Chryseosolibacter sp.]